MPCVGVALELGLRLAVTSAVPQPSLTMSTLLAGDLEQAVDLGDRQAAVDHVGDAMLARLGRALRDVEKAGYGLVRGVALSAPTITTTLRLSCASDARRAASIGCTASPHSASARRLRASRWWPLAYSTTVDLCVPGGVPSAPSPASSRSAAVRWRAVREPVGLRCALSTATLRFGRTDRRRALAPPCALCAAVLRVSSRSVGCGPSPSRRRCPALRAAERRHERRRPTTATSISATDDQHGACARRARGARGGVRSARGGCSRPAARARARGTGRRGGAAERAPAARRAAGGRLAAGSRPGARCGAVPAALAAGGEVVAPRRPRRRPSGSAAGAGAGGAARRGRARLGAATRRGGRGGRRGGRRTRRRAGVGAGARRRARAALATRRRRLPRAGAACGDAAAVPAAADRAAGARPAPAGGSGTRPRQPAPATAGRRAALRSRPAGEPPPWQVHGGGADARRGHGAAAAARAGSALPARPGARPDRRARCCTRAAAAALTRCSGRRRARARAGPLAQALELARLGEDQQREEGDADERGEARRSRRSG